MTAESLVAPRNAIANTGDPTQMFVANADGYNRAYSYADGLLTPRINTLCGRLARHQHHGGRRHGAAGLVAGNQSGNLVDQTQYAIIGNGNWVSATAQTTVKPVAYAQMYYGSQVTTGSAPTLTTNEDLTNGINTSSRGDLVVTEGYISGRIDVEATGRCPFSPPSARVTMRSRPTPICTPASATAACSCLIRPATAWLPALTGPHDPYPSRGAD